MTDQFSDSTVLKKVKSLIGEDGLKKAFAPIEEASGLPNAAYWSDEWLQLEQEHCFRKSWVFAGAVAELPNSGDMKPIEIGGAPTVLVHGHDGIIRGFTMSAATAVPGW